MEQRIDNNGDNLLELGKQQKLIDKHPFKAFKINDASILDTIEGREACERCYKSRKFFCYSCCIPVINNKFFPRVKLPIKIDIIKHRGEIDGKSTAIHAAIIAPEDVKIYTYPDFPELSPLEKTVLIFPNNTAKNVDDLFWKEKEVNGSVIKERIKNVIPITRAIFIDCTWHQTKAIYKDKRIRNLPCVILRSRISQFWRHQKKSPRWYLATIEALHQFLVEIHTTAYGALENYSEQEKNSEFDSNKVESYLDISKQPYKGQYDNLLYFFKYMYDKIHWLYDHDKLYAYKRPLL